MTEHASISSPIIIIGTGYGGIAMAVQLLKDGRDDFIMLEKADALGGTWRDNTYPGAECDIPSALYSFSFAPNPTWAFKWAKQPQILSYINDVVDRYGLRPKMRFGESVTHAEFDDACKRWQVTTRKGHIYDCQFLISSIGQLHHPNIPDIRGSDDFKGVSFHSARWNHDIDIAGKRIGVIGNAASAVQFIPEIAKTAGHVTVYQRSANWVIDKGDRPYTRLEKTLAKHAPWMAKIYRFGLWSLGEYVIWPIIKGAKLRAAIMRAKSRLDMKRFIKDPKLRAKLTPNYPLGAKRILFSDKYYAALARENVTLVTDPIHSITSAGIMVTDSSVHAHDILIWGTGFYTNPFLKEIDVFGTKGQRLRDHWAGGARAYMGTMTEGFPNLFILYGPNTNTGHTSIIFKLECQAGYTAQLIKAVAQTKQGAITVRPDAAQDFDMEMQGRLRQLAWDKVEASWYKDGDRLTNNWPGSSREFKRRTAKPKMEHFITELP